jgi:hypoxanthine phosphoribosyltransferase
MTISSYGKSQEYLGSVILQDTSLDLSGKDILIVDDIVDTGRTLTFVKSNLLKKNPKSFNILTLLDKKEKREVEIDVKYVGFVLDGSPWVEGYGLDGGKYGRGRPEIVTVK